MSMASISSTIIADVLVLVLTWTRTYTVRKLAADPHIEAPLLSLLLRDG